MDSFFSKTSRSTVGEFSLLFMGSGVFLAVNRPGREGDHLLPYNADLIVSGAITVLPHIPS